MVKIRDWLYATTMGLCGIASLINWEGLRSSYLSMVFVLTAVVAVDYVLDIMFGKEK